MATSSSAATPTLAGQVSEKLTRENYLLLKAQVLPGIYGAQLFGYLDRSIVEPVKIISVTDKDSKITTALNPVHTIWMVQDQQVLAYLLNSLSKEVLIQVVTLERTHAVWASLRNMFSLQSRSRINNLRISLTNAQKGNQSVVAYFAHMKALSDELVTTRKLLTKDELVPYILAGLDKEYNHLVSSLDACTDDVTLDELYSLMVNFDQRIELLQGSSTGKNHLQTLLSMNGVVNLREVGVAHCATEAQAAPMAAVSNH